ncbi:hypothetical protein D9613_012855 [Agrocybe pediades]|uniref:Uncharacterized protein n=1 Tax=Agrocybe pediades TaxID=84607 RepID=A0A8H4QWF4_9AGAR|nr:hypothetical protein D9613_012855 [Agrocybe pediades]
MHTTPPPPISTDPPPIGIHSNIDISSHLQAAIQSSASHFDMGHGDSEDFAVTCRPRFDARDIAAVGLSAQRVRFDRYWRLANREAPCERSLSSSPCRETFFGFGRPSSTAPPTRPGRHTLTFRTPSYHPQAYHRATARHDDITSTATNLLSINLPGGNWIGRRSRDARGKARTLQELKDQGFRTIEWDGRRPHAILDADKCIVAMMAGMPDQDRSWSSSMRDAAAAMKDSLDKGVVSRTLSPGEAHRRGVFSAIPSGVSYGGGQRVPGNLVLTKGQQTIVDRLINNKNIRRIAGFQSACLGLYFPKIYADYEANLSRLYRLRPTLRPNFSNFSIFPACTFNLGPGTSTFDHVDSANVAYGICAITALGSYDYTLGGHLVLFDLGLILEFPPGATILIPSSIFRHGNTPVIGPGAYRSSFTQYCAGGLFRWAQYGGRTADALQNASRLDIKALVSISTPTVAFRLSGCKTGADAKKVIDGSPKERTLRALSLFSTLDTLKHDRFNVFKPVKDKKIKGPCLTESIIRQASSADIRRMMKNITEDELKLIRDWKLYYWIPADLADHPYYSLQRTHRRLPRPWRTEPSEVNAVDFTVVSAKAKVALLKAYIEELSTADGVDEQALSMADEELEEKDLSIFEAKAGTILHDLEFTQAMMKKPTT